MRAKVHLIAAVGVITAVLVLSAIADEAIKDEAIKDERVEEEILPRHPLYASVHSDHRRLLKLGDVEDLPNYVYEDEEEKSGEVENVNYGDSVDGYNLPDSYSSAPSYADPTLLSAVMTQADEANFRYPIATTAPPASDQSAAGSKVDPFLEQPETNEINAFDLFPPQFHDLLEIPLHTYSNGSTFNTHNRYPNLPQGPLISKGYANTKIHGNSNIRTQSNQDTPQVSYKPKGVYQEELDEQGTTTKILTTRTSTTTTTTTTELPRRQTYPSTTEVPKWHTFPNTAEVPKRQTYPTTTELPRRQTYPSTTEVPKWYTFPNTAEVPKRQTYPTTTELPRRQTYPSTTKVPNWHTYPTTTEVTRRKPYVTPPPRNTFYLTTSKPSFLNDQPPQSTYHEQYFPNPTESMEDYHEEIDETHDTRAAIPDSIPPLRYTRRPTPRFTTKPTTRRPFITWSTTSPATATSPQFNGQLENETFINTEDTKRPGITEILRKELIRTRVPSLAPDTITTASSLSLIPVSNLQAQNNDQLKSPPLPQSPKREDVNERESFRPSKIDPYLKPRPHVVTTTEKRDEYFLEGFPEVLPPVVNTYEETTRHPPPVPNFSHRPDTFILPPASSSKPPLPPPPKPPSRPLLPPPPLPAGRPSLPPRLPPPPPSPNFSLPPRISTPIKNQPLAPQVLTAPPVSVQNDKVSNNIFEPPFPTQPVERPASSFAPPPRQPNLPNPRPNPTQFSGQSAPHRNQNARPHPPSHLFSRPSQQPPFQIVRPVVTPPPNPQDIHAQPDPGFTLPIEAGNLPKRPIQNYELAPHSENNGLNILPQFRPNAPPQHETFGFHDLPERAFETQPRPLRPDRRPVLSKRPSFLDNFNFFRRSSINRRRGETGPVSDINKANKIPNKQRTSGQQAIHYQLSHGPLPKNAQKVVVIGPFKEPPPGAPVIPAPDRDTSDFAQMPPPPPPPPSRKVSPPPRNTFDIRPHQGSPVDQESSVSKKGYFNPAHEHLALRPLMPTTNVTNKPQQNRVPDVVYGQLENTPMLNRVTNASRIPLAPVLSSDTKLEIPEDLLPVVNTLQEVSEQDKEAIIAGKFNFPAIPSIKRSSVADDGEPSFNYIPMPVPILPQQATPSPHVPEQRWSFLGFGPNKPKPPSMRNHIFADPSRTQIPPHKPNLIHALPITPSSLISSRNQLQQLSLGSRHPNIPKIGGPAKHMLPPPPVNTSNFPVENIPDFSNYTKDPLTVTSPLSITSTVSHADSELKSQTYEPRPVYQHTSTTNIPTSSRNPAETSTNPPTTTTTTTTKPTTAAITWTSPSTYSVTPMRITEFNPYQEYNHPVIENRRGVFKAPDIRDYGGWKVVGVPPAPSEGPGDALSPVVSYVKENTPEIIIMAPTSSIEDDDIVTGVISERMGEVGDGQLVQYSSRFNVETPGIVRSYSVKAPALV